MSNTTCLLRLVRRWNEWPQRGEDPHNDPLQLWELDMKEMFPSMKRDRVFAPRRNFTKSSHNAEGNEGGRSCLQ